jgi:hypothetical protein
MPVTENPNKFLTTDFLPAPSAVATRKEVP